MRVRVRGVVKLAICQLGKITLRSGSFEEKGCQEVKFDRLGKFGGRIYPHTFRCDRFPLTQSFRTR